LSVDYNADVESVTDKIWHVGICYFMSF